MSIKTENVTEVGSHVWERAGLGVAPFQFVAFEVKRYVACQGAPSQPGGICSYCGAALFNCCTVKDANGKRFIVGPDCIAKCGEEGILQAFKKSPEFRKHQREIRHAKEQRELAEIKELIAQHKSELEAAPHPMGFVDRKTLKPMTALDLVMFRFNACGASGRGAMLRAAKKDISIGKKPFGL